MSYSEPHIFSDFDETLIPYSSGVALVKHYIFNGKGLFISRFFIAFPLLFRRFRLSWWERYYKILRTITVSERKKALSKVPINQKWVLAVETIKKRFKKKSLNITIISGNCLDVIHDWVLVHNDELQKLNVKIHSIISSGPLDENYASSVKEVKNHMTHVAFGRLLSETKHSLIDKHTIFIGDGPDSVVKPYVKEYIKI